MEPDELLSRVPRQLAVSSQRPELRYEIADDMVATFDQGGEPVAHAIGSAAGRGRDAAGAGAIGPVYRRVPGGGLAVPTGRVLVRFPEGEPAESHRDQLATAGYDIDEVLSYAPHAAWLRARSGDVADSLAGIDRLVAQPGVENVEPQMIGEVSRRD